MEYMAVEWVNFLGRAFFCSNRIRYKFYYIKCSSSGIFEVYAQGFNRAKLPFPREAFPIEC